MGGIGGFVVCVVDSFVLKMSGSNNKYQLE
jgi:hypothetical protein